MAEPKERQLDSVQMEAEIQNFLQRERRELEMRQRLLREQEERQMYEAQGARPRFQSYQNQLENINSHLQQETRMRASSYRDQYAQMQGQRRNGV